MKQKKNFLCSQFHVSSGFTLIELLIVITIIIIFAGVSLAYYNNFIEEKKLETETQKLVDILELAKKKAAAADIGNYRCNPFFGYRVSITPSSYRLILCCALNCDTNYSIQNYNLEPNITISTGVGPVQFKPLSAGVISSTTIKLKNLSINKCQQIIINSAGVIESTTVGC